MRIIDDSKVDEGVLEISLDKENDYSILKEYPNVKKIIIQGFVTLTKDIVDGIVSNSKVNIIDADYSNYSSEKLAKEKDFNVLGWPYFDVKYKDITIQNSKCEPPIESAMSFPKMDILACSYEDLNFSFLDEMFNKVDERLKKDLRIIFTDGDNFKIEFGDDGIINNIEAKSDSLVNIVDIFNYFKNKGYSINHVNIEFKTRNYYNMDMSVIDEIGNYCSVDINYGELQKSSLEDFKGLQESVNWWRKIIMDAALSPVEKIMFAYDILKTFEYKENEKDKDSSRYAHLIVSTGNIVCVGYANLFKEILSNLDDGIYVSSFGCTCYTKDNMFLGGHQRSLVRVEDDKYNIHGIYACDATWDSDKSKKIGSENYTSLDLYRYFLIPRGLYRTVFLYDTVPDIFKFDTGEEFQEYFVGDSCMDLFPKNVKDKNRLVYKYQEIIDDNELKKKIDVPRPSLEMFNEMLYNVRMAEGYTKEEALSEVERVYLMNRKVIDLSAATDEEIPFFEDKKVKR